MPWSYTWYTRTIRKTCTYNVYLALTTITIYTHLVYSLKYVRTGIKYFDHTFAVFTLWVGDINIRKMREPQSGTISLGSLSLPTPGRGCFCFPGSSPRFGKGVDHTKNKTKTKKQEKQKQKTEERRLPLDHLRNLNVYMMQINFSRCERRWDPNRLPSSIENKKGGCRKAETVVFHSPLSTLVY